MEISILHDVAVSPNFAQKDKDSMCAYPQIALMANDTIACLYRCGTTKYSSDGRLMMQLSTDNGFLWSTPLNVFDGNKNSPREAVCCGGIAAGSSGELFVNFFTTLETPAETYLFSKEGKSLKRKISVIKSSDQGQSWSQAKSINFAPYQNVGTPTSPFELPDGRLCFPIEAETDKGVQSSVSVFSTIDCNEFTPININAGDNNGRFNYCDAHYTILDNGNILMLLWTFVQENEETINVHKSYSADNGLTWSTPEPTPIKGQVTVPLAHSSGKLIAATNYRDYPEGIYLWVSEDNGTSWAKDSFVMWNERKKQITGTKSPNISKEHKNEGVWEALQGFTFGTPDLKELNDGSILMSYYATLDNIVHVRACRFKII